MPTNWHYYNAVAGPTGPFVFAGSVSGSSAIIIGAVSGDWYYIVGVDGSGNPVSANSNVVQCT